MTYLPNLSGSENTLVTSSVQLSVTFSCSTGLVMKELSFDGEMVRTAPNITTKAARRIILLFGLLKKDSSHLYSWKNKLNFKIWFDYKTSLYYHKKFKTVCNPKKVTTSQIVNSRLRHWKWACLPNNLSKRRHKRKFICLGKSRFFCPLNFTALG